MSDTYGDMIDARNLLDVAYKMLSRIDVNTLANEFVDKEYFEAREAIYKAWSHIHTAIKIQGDVMSTNGPFNYRQEHNMISEEFNK